MRLILNTYLPYTALKLNMFCPVSRLNYKANERIYTIPK